jgi:alanine dehydrogenase
VLGDKVIVGCPKEIKVNEKRVGLTPLAVRAYVEAGHEVLIESGAGQGAGLDDEAYRLAGAKIVANNVLVWEKAELIVKVKELLPPEYPLAKPYQIVFTFFHLAASLELTLACLERKITAIAYETVTVGGELPLLKPMSAVAGRVAILAGATHLASFAGGKGILPVGALGGPPAKVLIIGGGVVGQNAALTATGLGLTVTVLDKDPVKLDLLRPLLPDGSKVLLNEPNTLVSELKKADIIIGAVLNPGAKAPKVISREQLKLIQPGSVLVDVAIDQGGCFESSRLTTLSDPVYVEEGVVHYCVGNMPGAYAKTAALALSEATLPYGLTLASGDLKTVLLANPPLLSGLNAYAGYLTLKPVAEAFGLEKSYRASLTALS